jgi:hypothetical protein
MPVPAHHSLLDVPRVRPDFEHVQVVIRFEDQAMAAADVVLDVLRNVSKVGDNADPDALRVDTECDRIGGVVRDGEGRDLDVSDHEFLSRRKHLKRFGAAIPGNRLARCRAKIDGSLRVGSQSLKPSHVIDMFGGDYGVESAALLADRFELCGSRLPACVDEDAGLRWRSGSVAALPLPSTQTRTLTRFTRGIEFCLTAG